MKPKYGTQPSWWFLLAKKSSNFSTLFLSLPSATCKIPYNHYILAWKKWKWKKNNKGFDKKKNQLLPTILQRRMPNVRAASLDTPTVSLPSLVVSLYHVYNNSFSFFRENTCDNIILIQFKLLSILISHLYRKRHLCTSILCKHDFLNRWIYNVSCIFDFLFKAALTVSCMAMNGDAQLKLIQKCVLTSQKQKYLFEPWFAQFPAFALIVSPLVLVPLISKPNTLKSCFAVFILCQKVWLLL